MMSTEGQDRGGILSAVTTHEPSVIQHSQNLTIPATELTGKDHLRRSLETQGVTFIIQTRSAEVPVINMRKLEDNIVGVDNGEKASRIIGALTAYLETPSVADSWEENHAGRRIWKSEMLQKYGVIFRELYEDNQLRVNHISPVYEGVMALGNLIPGERKFTPIHRQLKTIQDHLKPVTDAHVDHTGQRFPKGEEYNRMPSQEKIKFVQGLEDHIVALLHIMAKGNSSPSKQPRLILMT